MLLTQIKDDLKQAMKAGDREKVTCLRMLVAALTLKEKDLHREPSDDEVLSVLRTQLKQVSDSIGQYAAGGREDLAQAERQNQAILKVYLPQEMSSEELEAIVAAVVAETGATKKEFGAVMKLVMARTAGRADGKLINQYVSRALN